MQLTFDIPRSTLIDEDYATRLEALKNSVLGESHLMTLQRPVKEGDGLVGGTYFERLGQKGVKGTRCYSISLTGQPQNGLVGPTAGGKVLDPRQPEQNIILRRKLLEVS